MQAACVHAHACVRVHVCVGGEGGVGAAQLTAEGHRQGYGQHVDVVAAAGGCCLRLLLLSGLKQQQHNPGGGGGIGARGGGTEGSVGVGTSDTMRTGQVLIGSVVGRAHAQARTRTVRFARYALMTSMRHAAGPLGLVHVWLLR